MGEISAASREQSAGVAQVGEAVTHMDQATQQNAALVEESAAAADSLRTQAEQLVQAMAFFQVRGNGGHAAQASGSSTGQRTPPRPIATTPAARVQAPTAAPASPQAPRAGCKQRGPACRHRCACTLGPERAPSRQPTGQRPGRWDMGDVLTQRAQLRQRLQVRQAGTAWIGWPWLKPGVTNTTGQPAAWAAWASLLESPTISVRALGAQGLAGFQQGQGVPVFLGERIATKHLLKKFFKPLARNKGWQRPAACWSDRPGASRWRPALARLRAHRDTAAHTGH